MKRRRLFPLVLLVGAALGGRAAVGCNSVSVVPLPQCTRDSPCTCEEDPTQPTCKGSTGLGDSGTIMGADASDGMVGTDATDASDASDANDAADGPDDGGDEAG